MLGLEGTSGAVHAAAAAVLWGCSWTMVTRSPGAGEPSEEQGLAGLGQGSVGELRENGLVWRVTPVGGDSRSRSCP